MVKNPSANAGDVGLIPGSGRSFGGGHGNPLQYSCMENTCGQRGLVAYCPWDLPGENTEVGCHFLLQVIFPSQGSNPHLLHWQTDSLPLNHQGSLRKVGDSVLMEDIRFQQIPLQSGRDLSFVDCGFLWSQWTAFLPGRLPADTEPLIQQ